MDEERGRLRGELRRNRRGCFILIAALIVILAAWAYGMFSSDDDLRSNIITDVKGPTTPAPSPRAAPAVDPAED